MNQYFVKYTLNGKDAFNQFTVAINVNSGITAEQSGSNVISEIRRQHNIIAELGKNAAYYKITNEDVVISVLTRLN